MWKYLVNILLCTSFIYCTSDDHFCCAPGDYLQRPYNNVQYCLDIETGNRTNVALDCPNTILVAYTDRMKYIINEDGQLVFLLPNRQVVYEEESYCVGKYAHSKSRKVTGRVVLICDQQKERVISEDVHAYCMLVSVVFLIVTAVLYVKHGHYRDLQGKSLINLCVSLAIGLSILVAMKMIPYSDMDLCAARGFFAYFFMLVSFFWMNAVAIQIIWSLRLLPGTKTGHEWKSFAGYAAYAWGVPAVLAIIMAVINFIPGDHLKPGIGLNHCWFFDPKQQWHYMYSVVSVLILVNIALFVSATVFICCYGFPSQHETFKHKFATCLQLLIVMGIPWIFEMISSLSPPHVAWEITDLFNALQGVWIFLVLVVFRRQEKEEDKLLYNMNITIEQPNDKISKY